MLMMETDNPVDTPHVTVTKHVVDISLTHTTKTRASTPNAATCLLFISSPSPIVWANKQNISFNCKITYGNRCGGYGARAQSSD